MSACAAGYADHVDPDRAMAFADGTLGATERAEVERRIDACSACRGVVAMAARDTDPPTKLEKPRANASVKLTAGEQVGRYVVERALGAGGMGVVNLARDPELRRAVVIKLVRPDALDDDMEARLKREAQAMAQLSHPNVVQIFDIGRHGDRVFLAMEFIAGHTLDAWLIERERSADEIIAMFLQCGAGLEAAHRAGLLHRDFKPTNVLVDRNGVAKVTDFGLARAIAGPVEASTPQPRMSGVHAVLTHADAVIGTPAYMAPEQAAGQPLDARTDQYALALALLDALVGQQASKRVVRPGDAVDGPLAAAKVSARARAAIARALAVDPDQRWPDLASFLRELAPEKPRRKWPFVVAGVAAIAGIGAFVALRPEASCVAKTPRTWAAAREAVRAKLSGDGRELAGWHAEHVLAQIQSAVDGVGLDEVAQCEGKQVDTACLAQRKAAIAAIPSAPDVHFDGCVTKPSDDIATASALDQRTRDAMATGYFDQASAALVEETSLGERTGDDAIRGRALLGTLELARMRGDLPAARDAITQLDAMLQRHGNAPHDVVTVALATANALTELGDAPKTFAALDRARRAAQPDERDAVQRTDTRARKVLRLDDTAIVPDRFADATLAELDAMPAPDPTTRARIEIARARLLVAAGNFVEAKGLLEAMFKRTRVPSSPSIEYEHVGLSAYELADAWLVECEAMVGLHEDYGCYKPMALEKAHPDSPQIARQQLFVAKMYEMRSPILVSGPLQRAIDILATAQAKPLYLAELRLQLVRLDGQPSSTRRKQAALAREVFAAANRTAEVAEIDRITAELDAKYGPPVDPWH